jgi:hypothetical protein
VDGVLAAELRAEAGTTITLLSRLNWHDTGLFPALMQAGQDVHGSHGLFYWLRARQRGWVITRGPAAVVVAWRPDVQRLVALRPVGDAVAAADLLDTVTRAAALAVPGARLVARYCGQALAQVLLDRGWGRFSGVWSPGTPRDDEAHPEVIITGAPTGMPPGRHFKSVREAVRWHRGAYRFHASSRLLTGGQQVPGLSAAQAHAGLADAVSFEAAVASALDGRDRTQLTYHYLHHGSQLAGFAITGNTTGVAHGYYLWTARVPRLATYFLWQIYRHEHSSGASALNLGGSETLSLFRYKTKTFPEHVTQPTSILCPPLTQDGEPCPAGRSASTTGT